MSINRFYNIRLGSVELRFFKSSGKWYSDETLYLPVQMYAFEVYEFVRAFFFNGKRPGLVDGFDFPYCLVTPSFHDFVDFNVPVLIILDERLRDA